MYRKLSLVLAILILGCAPTSTEKENKVLLVSFDGFRYDYLTKTETPHFDALVEDGSTAEGLIPIFPSVTFPNYYAIATGLYPENNGFINNSMYDSTIGEWFSMGNREQVENPAWYGGEPIWNTVEKNGKKAGTMFWVGSEAPIQNMRPTYWKRYDGEMPNQDRIDTVLNWMTSGTQDEIDFGTLYFDFVDGTGHRHGPNSDEIIEAIQQADELVGYLTQKLNELGLIDQTNVIIVADHGMAQVSDERLVFVDEFLQGLSEIEVTSYSPNFMANGPEGELKQLFERMKAEQDHFKVYLKADIPEEYHVKNSPRFPELLAMAEVGYTLSTREFVERRPGFPSGGVHGYDNKAKEMQGLFLAVGPDFEVGEQLGEIENIHIYELIAHLLNIPSAGTDGNLETFRPILKN